MTKNKQKKQHSVIYVVRKERAHDYQASYRNSDSTLPARNP